MTYLVQKTNMFKQKMKIDDNIICNKMLTVQLWCICTWIRLRSIVLTKAVMYYPWLAGNNFRWRALFLSGETVCYFIPLQIWGPDCERHVPDEDMYKNTVRTSHKRVFYWSLPLRNTRYSSRLLCWGRGTEAMLALSGHPDTTTQKCSRAENILLCKPVGSFLL